MNQVVILVGMSGSGKTTILNALIKRHPNTFKKILEYTNRPIRDGELEGKDYRFRNEVFFEQNDFIAKKTYQTVFGDWHYGFTREQFIYDPYKTQILVTGSESARRIAEELRQTHKVHIIFLNPSFNAIKKRLEDRGDNVDEVNRRMLADASDFQYMHRYCDLEVTTYFYEFTIDLVERYLRKVGVL